MSEFPHLSPGSVRFQTSEVRVVEARNTITGTRVFIIEGAGAEALLPAHCRVLERHAGGILVTLPFRLPGEKTPPAAAPVPAPPPAVTEMPPAEPPASAVPAPVRVQAPAAPPVRTPAPVTPPPQPAKPVRKQAVKPITHPAAQSPAKPPAAKRPPLKLPKLPRIAVYAFLLVPLVVAAIVFIIRTAPSGGAPESASIAHLVDIGVVPAGLPPARLVVDSAPKQSGIEPGTVLGSIPKRVVFSFQGDWVVHGEYDDQRSSPVTIRIPHDRNVTIVFPD